MRPSSAKSTAALKLIHVDDTPDELFDLAADPGESHNLLAQRPATVTALDRALGQMAQRVARERDALPAGAAVDLDNDELLQQRLRGLGYLE